MGNYYRTASANPLDYMYKLNTPLMEKVIDANDSYITENLNQLGTLDKAATSFSYLDPDEERANKIAQGYSDKIDTLVSNIKDDPANWRSQLDPIRTLGAQIQKDYTTGEISKITENYNKYKTVSDYIDKQVGQMNKTGKNGITVDRATAYKKYFLDQFTKANPEGTAYNPNTGEYNAINTFEPMNDMDIKKVLADGVAKMKASGEDIKQDEVTGMYIRKTEKGWEGVTPERVLQAMKGNISPELLQYMRQDSQVGLLSGVFDNKGSMIEPYNYNPVSPTQQELQTVKDKQKIIDKLKKSHPEQARALQSQLDNYSAQLKDKTQFSWNNDSYLAKIMQGVVAEGAWSKSKEFDELKPDQVGIAKFTQSQINNRDTLNRASREAIAAANRKAVADRFRETQDFNKEKWEWQRDHPGATKGTKSVTNPTGAKPGDKDAPVINQPEESSVSKFATNSFQAWQTKASDGSDVPVLSVKGIAADLDRYKDQYDQATKRIHEIQDQRWKDLNDKANRVAAGDHSALIPTAAEKLKHDADQIELEQLQKSLPELQTDIEARRTWYKKSVEAALNNNPLIVASTGSKLTPEEVALYNKFNNDRGGEALQNKIKESSSEYAFPSLNQGTYSNFFSNWMSKFNKSEEGTNPADRRELTDYMKVKQKVDNARDAYLTQIRKDDISTKSVSIGRDLNDYIATKIFDPTQQGLKMYDVNGDPADKMRFKEGELLKYMAKWNVTPIIEQVGNTTALGTGNAVVKLSFNDPTNHLPKSPFFIELTPELQKEIGNKIIQTSKNPDVKATAGSLLDEESNNLRRQMIIPHTNKTTGVMDQKDPITKTILIPNGSTRVPVQMSMFTSSDGADHITMQYRDKDGNLVPLDIPTLQNVNGHMVPIKNPLPGWYNGIDDFLDKFKKFKEGGITTPTN